MLAAEKSSQSWPTSTEKCQDDNRASVDSSETDESDNHEYYSGDIDSAGKQNDVILAFINSDEEDANKRPNATRSGLAIKRSQIDFSFF